MLHLQFNFMKPQKNLPDEASEISGLFIIKSIGKKVLSFLEFYSLSIPECRNS